MSGFYGTEQQMALQAAVEGARDWLAQTPGASNPGRCLGTNAPKLLGWDTIFEILRRDKIFGFSLVSSGDLTEIEAQLRRDDFRVDFYDVFIASAAETSAAVTQTLAAGLPEGFRFGAPLDHAEGQRTQAVQAFMGANGVSPFSGSMLVGDDGPARTVTILDQHDNLAATAYAFFPHNVHSKHNKSAWGGLAAVSPTHRGKGLGKLVNAKMVADSIADLGATSIHEYVAATNMPSRKMVEACGLRLDPELKGGIAVPAGADKFTR